MAVVSARGSPHSFPSSPLPASPQPDAERMFMRGGSGRSTGTSRTTSLREIDEEAAVVDDGSGKLYVAVGKDLKDGKSNLSAARSLRLLGDLKLILLHVHQPKSKLAAIVHQQAKPYCQIFFIYKESLACTREANLDSMNADSPRSTLSDGPELPARSVSLPPGHPGYMSSPDQQVPPRRSNSVNYPSSGLIAKNVERMSHIVQHSVHMTARNCSPNSSLPRNGRFSSSSLVTLIGVCRDPKVLVYEFLPNGSLEDRLQCKHHTEALPWRMRIGIAADICTALIFLHSNKPKGIAHGDLKPDNVLLDANFVGKLGDFGISRSLNLTNTTVTPYHRTDQIKGTFGYMDPGYIASGELTAQYDVYSFGVVLLRLLTGKSPLGLQSEVEAALTNGVLHEILDASAGEWPHEYAEELASLALKCCRYDRKERPDLAKEAWGVLQGMMNEPPSSSLLCPDDKCKAPAPSYFILENGEDPCRHANMRCLEGGVD